MSVDEIRYKGWSIEVLHAESGWKALIYRPNWLLHQEAVPDGADRRAVMEEAKALVGSIQA